MSKLNIVNQQENIIGQEDRKIIHRDALWHQEVNIWFYTPKQEIIFQHRSKNKDIFADKLDATVGGHVEIGDDYNTTAIKEIKEETGLDLNIEDLEFIRVIKRSLKEKDIINNAFQGVYIYKYNDDLDDLVIEKNKNIGFEVYDINNLMHMDDDKNKFISGTFSPEILEIFQIIKNKFK